MNPFADYVDEPVDLAKPAPRNDPPVKAIPPQGLDLNGGNPFADYYTETEPTEPLADEGELRYVTAQDGRAVLSGKPSRLTAGLVKAGQGLSRNWIDEGVGKGAQLFEAVRAKIAGREANPKVGERYRDDLRQLNRLADEHYPAQSAAIETVGDVVTQVPIAMGTGGLSLLPPGQAALSALDSVGASESGDPVKAAINAGGAAAAGFVGTSLGAKRIQKHGNRLVEQGLEETDRLIGTKRRGLEKAQMQADSFATRTVTKEHQSAVKAAQRHEEKVKRELYEYLVGKRQPKSAKKTDADKIKDKLIDLDAAQEALAVSRQSALGPEYQRDMQLKHLAGDLPEDKLVPEAADWKQKLDERQVDIVNERALGPSPEQRVEKRFASKQKAIETKRAMAKAKLEAAGKPITPESLAAEIRNTPDVDPEVLSSLLAERLEKEAKAGVYRKPDVLTADQIRAEADRRLSDPAWLKDNHPELYLKLQEFPPDATDDQLAESLRKFKPGQIDSALPPLSRPQMLRRALEVVKGDKSEFARYEDAKKAIGRGQKWRKLNEYYDAPAAKAIKGALSREGAEGFNDDAEEFVEWLRSRGGR